MPEAPTDVAPAHEAPPVGLRFTIFTEKIPGEGEDAEPLIVDHGGRTYLAALVPVDLGDF